MGAIITSGAVALLGLIILLYTNYEDKKKAKTES
jgi:hypothetical protein